jgi:hypothetical protein
MGTHNEAFGGLYFAWHINNVRRFSIYGKVAIVSLDESKDFIPLYIGNHDEIVLSFT